MLIVFVWLIQHCVLSWVVGNLFMNRCYCTTYPKILLVEAHIVNNTHFILDYPYPYPRLRSCWWALIGSTHHYCCLGVGHLSQQNRHRLSLTIGGEVLSRLNITPYSLLLTPYSWYCSMELFVLSAFYSTLALDWLKHSLFDIDVEGIRIQSSLFSAVNVYSFNYPRTHW